MREGQRRKGRRGRVSKEGRQKEREGRERVRERKGEGVDDNERRG